MAEHVPPETGGLTERGDGAAVVCEDQGRIRVPSGRNRDSEGLN